MTHQLLSSMILQSLVWMPTWQEVEVEIRIIGSLASRTKIRTAIIDTLISWMVPFEDLTLVWYEGDVEFIAHNGRSMTHGIMITLPNEGAGGGEDFAQNLEQNVSLALSGRRVMVRYGEH